MTTMEIPLGASGEVAVIDSADYELVRGLSWSLLKVGKARYAAAWSCMDGIKGCELMHRLILNARRGEPVKHIDLDGLNNTRANIKIASRSNISLSAPNRVDNKSGERGVWLETHNGNTRWRAQATANKKVIKRRFKKREDAVEWIRSLRSTLLETTA